MKKERSMCFISEYTFRQKVPAIAPPNRSTHFLLESSSIFRPFFSAARPKCYDYKCPKHYKPRYGYEDKECDKDGCRDDDCCEKECE